MRTKPRLGLEPNCRQFLPTRVYSASNTDHKLPFDIHVAPTSILVASHTAHRTRYSKRDCHATLPFPCRDALRPPVARSVSWNRCSSRRPRLGRRRTWPGSARTKTYRSPMYIYCHILDIVLYSRHTSSSSIAVATNRISAKLLEKQLVRFAAFAAANSNAGTMVMPHVSMNFSTTS